MKYQIIAILLLCVLLIFVVLPVGHSLDVVNVHFTQVVGAVAVASLALLLWRRKVFSCSAIDVVMLLWFVYVAVRAYLQPIYPTASFFLQALTMLSLYFALRLLFSAVRFDERFIVIALVLCGLSPQDNRKKHCNCHFHFRLTSVQTILPEKNDHPTPPPPFRTLIGTVVII